MIKILETLGYSYDASPAVSPILPFLKLCQSIKARKRMSTYGSFWQNIGMFPKCKLNIIPSTSILTLPFYGSIHFYAPFGQQIFRLQKRQLPNVISYIFHAFDFSSAPSVYPIRKRENHFEFMKEILDCLTEDSNRLTTKEFVNQKQIKERAAH